MLRALICRLKLVKKHQNFSAAASPSRPVHPGPDLLSQVGVADADDGHAPLGQVADARLLVVLQQAEAERVKEQGGLPDLEEGAEHQVRLVDPLPHLVQQGVFKVAGLVSC